MPAALEMRAHGLNPRFKILGSNRCVRRLDRGTLVSALYGRAVWMWHSLGQTLGHV